MTDIPQPNAPIEANKQCVAALERWLTKAKRGEMKHVTIIGCDNYIHNAIEFAGAMDLCFAANWGLDTAKARLMNQLNTRHEMPIPTIAKDQADRACYDISKGPACFDFLCWLTIAEMIRRKAGAPGPLKVAFKMEEGEAEAKKHQELRAKFYDGVIIPSLGMVGAVIDPASVNATPLDFYTLKEIVKMNRAGQDVPKLMPSSEAVEVVREQLAGDRPITITLREANYTEYRNSNISEWLKVADWLKEQGERVIFIRDTARAHDALGGQETCPPASLDLHIRTALYDASKLNLFVSNGPWTMALFGDKPWLMFFQPDSMSDFFPETPQFWTTWHGIDPMQNEQFPWCTEDQRIVWKKDNADNIIDAIKALPAMAYLSERAEAAE